MVNCLSKESFMAGGSWETMNWLVRTWQSRTTNEDIHPPCFVQLTPTCTTLHILYILYIYSLVDFEKEQDSILLSFLVCWLLFFKAKAKQFWADSCESLSLQKSTMLPFCNCYSFFFKFREDFSHRLPSDQVRKESRADAHQAQLAQITERYREFFLNKYPIWWESSSRGLKGRAFYWLNTES